MRGQAAAESGKGHHSSRIENWPTAFLQEAVRLEMVAVRKEQRSGFSPGSTPLPNGQIG